MYTYSFVRNVKPYDADTHGSDSSAYPHRTAPEKGMSIAVVRRTKVEFFADLCCCKAFP